jgi:hypothetical protein
VTLDSSPAVHQSVQLGEECLLVLSSPSSLLGGIPAEPLPLCGTCDPLVEPFARVCDTTEFGDQLRLTHLVQAHHRERIPPAPEALLLLRAPGLPVISVDADQVGSDDQ